MNEMKESNAGIEGGSAGSLGEATASDLERGYTKPECDHDEHNYPEAMKEEKFGGFVGRPNGFER